MLNTPTGVAVDGLGNVYIADMNNHCVRKVSATGGIISTIAGIGGAAGYGGDGGPAIKAHLNFPTDVTVDKTGNLFIADCNNQRIRKIDTAGIISTFAGNEGVGFNDSTIATNAVLNYPVGVTSDTSGNVYIADADNNLIRMVDTIGKIHNIAGILSPGYNGDNMPALAAQLNYPTKVAFGAGGVLLIADQFNNRVRKINTGGMITTVAGTGINNYGGDEGMATDALLNLPVSVAAYGNKIFVADYNNNRIRVVNTAFTAIAGSNTVFTGSSIDLSNAATGGIWTATDSSKILLAPTGSSLNVTGLRAGSDTIFYSVDSVVICKVIDVIDTPGAIMGPNSICVGSSYVLTDSALGGVWSSGDPTVATVGRYNGFVTGVSPGITFINYTIGSLVKTLVINVSPTPAAITGDTLICKTVPGTLHETSTSGTWSSTRASVATISPAGIVAGISVGTDTIVYTNPSSCLAYYVVRIDSAPVGITMSGTLCIGGIDTFINAMPACIWHSNSVSITVTDSVNGIVRAFSSGVDTIIATNGCGVSTMVITVNPSVSVAIAGPAAVCVGSVTPFTDSSTGGIWYSSDPAVAFMDSISGAMIAALSGNVTISYKDTATGCSAVKPVRVDAPPQPISAVTEFIYTGNSLELTDATTGGTWSVSDSICSIDLTGPGTAVLTANSDGFEEVFYQVSDACGTASKEIYISIGAAAPGINFIVDTNYITIPNTISKGSFTLEYWMKTNQNAAPSGPEWYYGSGILDAWMAGEYNDFGTSLLGDRLAFGMGNPDVTITSSRPVNTGLWTHIAVSWNEITGEMKLYVNGLLDTSAFTMTPVRNSPRTIYMAPPYSPVHFFGNLDEVRLWDTVRSDVDILDYMYSDVPQDVHLVSYYRFDEGIANGYNKTGNNDGKTLTDYSGNGNCGLLYNFNLTGDSSNFVPGAIGTTFPIFLSPHYAITGNKPLCAGAYLTLLDSATGLWSVSNTTLAQINAFSPFSEGIIGTINWVDSTVYDTVSYFIYNECGSIATTTVLTINPIPYVAPLSPQSYTLCAGSHVAFTDTSYGGRWSVSNTDAEIDSFGNFYALNTGAVTVDYSIIYPITNCASASIGTVVINNVPPMPDPITGVANYCSLTATTLSDLTAGGVWKVANPLIDSIVVTMPDSIVIFGLVPTALQVYDTITYTVSNECGPSSPSILIDTVRYGIAPPEILPWPQDTTNGAAAYSSLFCATSSYMNFCVKAPGIGHIYTWTADNADIFASSKVWHNYCLVNFPAAGNTIIYLADSSIGLKCRSEAAKWTFTVNNLASSYNDPAVVYNSGVFMCVSNDSLEGHYKWGWENKDDLVPHYFDNDSFQFFYYPNANFTNNYYWVEIIKNNCGTKVYYQDPASVGSIKTPDSKDILAYPNPNNGNFEVRIPINCTEAKIAVYDMAGQKVFEQHNACSGGHASVALGEKIANGNYFLTIQMGEMVLRQIIVVDRRY